MDFGGDLSVLDPSMVFQVASVCGLTGKLKLITIENVASFFIKDGELIYATIDTRKKKLGQFLIEKGYIDQVKLDEALDEYKHGKGMERIGNILIRHGYLDFESLQNAMQEQMKEVVYEVLTWKTGQFVFFNKVTPEHEDIFLDIKMDYLILEGLKRIDEADRPG
ncbi:MAG: DUF4388 domain-containing protein [Candidatus Krumholzibacteriota bacterium]|nr:DUF4388 domain-containing protein [Candidatus Krumholzibacteriota bacterium]